VRDTQACPSLQDVEQETAPPRKIIDNWKKGTLTRYFGQETFAHTILQCGISPKTIEAYRRERDNEHASQQVLSKVASVSGHNAAGVMRCDAVQQLRLAQQKLEIYENKDGKGRGTWRVREAKAEVLACQQQVDTWTLRVGTGLTASRELLPDVRIRGVASRVALRLTGNSIPTDRCTFCGHGSSVLLCHLCQSPICDQHCFYIGGGAKGDGKRKGGAQASCVDHQRCRQQQLANARALERRR